MKSIPYLLFFLCVLSVAIQARDAGRIEVRLTSDEVISTMPGNVVTTAVEVSNKTARTQELITNIKLPKRWRTITREIPYELQSENSIVKLVSVLVPPGTPVGKYNVFYDVQLSSYEYYKNSCNIQIIVTPFHKLKTEILTEPEYVVAGNRYQVSFLVTNESNTSNNISAKINSSENYSFTYNIEKWDDDNSKAKKINITVQTDKNCKKAFMHKVYLTTKSKHHDECKSVSVSKVKVIPRVSGYKSRYNLFPVTISMGEFLQKNGKSTHGFQADIKGEGTFDEANKKNFKFQLRGPDIYDRSILARRDEYFASYWTKNIEIHAGDRIYQLSTLTERARYGRGVEGKINIWNFSLGSYYLKARWLRTVYEEVASYLKYTFNGKHSIGLNYLNKRSIDGKNNIMSVTTKLQPLKNNSFEFEYSSGLEKNGKQTSYLARLFGRNSKYDYSLRWIHASPEFPGYYRNTDYLTAGFNIWLLRNLNFNAQFRHEKQNFDLDTLRYAAPLIKYFQAGFQYRFKKNTRITFAFQEHGRKDRFDEAKFNYSEKALRVGISRNIGKFSFMARAEIGKTDNHLTRQTYDMNRYTFSSHFRPTQRHDISGYIYYNNYSWFTGELMRRLTAGVRLSLMLSDKTSFYLNYQNHYSPEEYYFDRNAFEFRLNYTLPNNFQMYLQGRQTLMRNSFHNRETAIMLGFSVPVGIPISRKKNVGVVKGTVFDEETNKPVQDLILHINGSTAVTDKNGKFIFPALSPQTYYLTLDKSNVGLNKVTLRKSPIEIVLHDGDVVDIYLFITTGSTCSGQVTVGPDLNNEEQEINSPRINNRLRGPAIDRPFVLSGDGLNRYSEENGLPNIFVEMKRDDEVLSRVTDSKGFFKFEDIRPGDWIIKFYEKNLPQYHKFKNNVYHVNLKPGDKKRALLKVYPQQRRIRMQQEESILEFVETDGNNEEKTRQNIKKVETLKDSKKVKTIEMLYKINLRLYRQKKYQEALRGFQQLLQSNPQNILAGNFQYWMGECFHSMGQTRKALEAFQAVLKYNCYFKHADALIKCGIINKKLGNRTIAQKCFQKVIDIFPYSHCVPIANKYLRSI